MTTGRTPGVAGLPRFGERVGEQPGGAMYLSIHGGGDSDGQVAVTGLVPPAALVVIGGGDSDGSVAITMNIPPTANAGGPYSCIAGTSVLLDPRASSDLYGPYDVWWLPGDGREGNVEYGPWVGADGAQPFTYPTAGVYQARVRVKSQATGLESVAYATVTVQSLAGVASVAIYPDDGVFGVTGETVPVSAAAFDSDGRQVTGLPITWESYDTNVAALLGDVGEAISLLLGDAGSTTLVATCGGVDSAPLPVVVTAVSPVYQVAVTPAGPISGSAGGSVQFTATVTD